jgi:hypothetical protein
MRHTTTSLTLAAALTILTTAPTWAGLPPGLLPGHDDLGASRVIVLPTLDREALLAEDASETGSERRPRPNRFAVAQPASLTPADFGAWKVLDDGWHAWRGEISSPGALSLNLRFDIFDLPVGARLWIHDGEGGTLHGPYTSDNRDRRGGLSTPVVLGDTVAIELLVPPGQKRAELARIGQVNHGYRAFGEAASAAKQGSCNIDVVCPEGNAWRDQIRSVARYTITTIEGTFLCTGTLVNNHRLDERPLFLSADHCGVTPNSDHTMVVYWNYESAVCGNLSGGSLATNQLGATTLAQWDWDTGSDFLLVELDDPPPPNANVYFAGWDAGGAVPGGAVGIHHPSGDEKAISFEYDALGTIWNSHWVIPDWDLGTTEQGSSGSCIFDPSSRRCVGTLSGGHASCSNPTGDDWYGKVSVSWNGNGTVATRLRDHLDPDGTGVLFLDGMDPGGVTPSGVSWLIPAVASTPGAGGTDWRSEIVVANPTASPVTATMSFVAEGAAWPGIQLGSARTVPANGTLYLEDPVVAYRPTAGIMVVTVTSDEATVMSRTYNLAPSGATFGQGIPPVALETATAPDEVMIPFMHSAPARFRTNVGLIQASSGSFQVRVTVYDSSGSPLGARTYTVSSGYFQANNIMSELGLSNQIVEGGWIRVELLSGAPAYWTAWGSVVDANTGDGTYVLPVER